MKILTNWKTFDNKINSLSFRLKMSKTELKTWKLRDVIKAMELMNI